MFDYRYSELRLQSNVPLPELAKVPPDLGTDLTFQFHSQPYLGAYPDRWTQEWGQAEGTAFLQISPIRNGHLFHFPDLADFHAVTNSRSESLNITGYAPPGLPPETIRHLLLDQVLPTILGRFGRKALHASAVAQQAGVLAFLGASGRGKSSLAAAFARSGWRQMSDDCLILRQKQEGIFASVAYQGVRLMPDAIETLAVSDEPRLAVAHYSTKQRLPGWPPPATDSASLPLRFLFVLNDPEQEPAEEIRLERMSARDAFLALREGIFTMDVDDAIEAAFEFRLLSQTANQVRAFRLAYPRNWALLPRVLDHILAAIGG